MINPLYQNELDEIDQQEEEERQSFSVTDLESLNWVLRKMAAIEAKKNEVNKLAMAEMHRIEEYKNKEIEKLDRDNEYFQGLIGAYASAQRINDPKFKAKTPYGSVSYRKQQPKWHYNDDELVGWLEANQANELIRVKKEPAKTEIKKLFIPTETGQVVDPDGQLVAGINVEYRSDELVVKVEV